MKKIYRNKIINIENTDKFDNKFLFEHLVPDLFQFDKEKPENKKRKKDIEIIFLSNLLEKHKNLELLEKVKQKPAIYANVYSAETELKIFTELFEKAIKNNQKIHIIWITLKEEIEILENYYKKLWFFDEMINGFNSDFSVPLVTASVNIENLIWKWSDYKAQREKIFFNPPIRESWQNKAMFKWINRWVTASINIKNLDEEKKEFLENCIRSERILPITLAKVLSFNLEDIWFKWKKDKLIVKY